METMLTPPEMSAGLHRGESGGTRILPADIGFDRYPREYPFALGIGERITKTTVLSREELVMTVLDMTRFKGAYREMSGEMAGKMTFDIVKNLWDRRPDVMEDLFRIIRENAFLQEVRDWLLANGRVFHIDEFGMLYVHAGIPAKEDMDIGYFEWIELPHHRPPFQFSLVLQHRSSTTSPSLSHPFGKVRAWQGRGGFKVKATLKW